jgi:tRNA threonylcarbamoyladenosine biosynthesis protein TsaB
MTYLLCIETATEICSIAVSAEGKMLSLQESSEPYNHTELMNLLIAKAMEQAAIDYSDLSGIVISEGPGSYTSLRVGTASAKAFCMALDLPLVPIPTLKSLAAGAMSVNQKFSFIVPMIDARRLEVYTEIFDAFGNSLRPLHNLVLTESSFEDYSNEKVLFIGNGCEKFKSIASFPNWEFQPSLCTAKNLVSLGYQYFVDKKYIFSENFSPLYLKNPNVTQSKRELF